MKNRNIHPYPKSKKTWRRVGGEYQRATVYQREIITNTFSAVLNRTVKLEIIRPVDCRLTDRSYPLLLLNDGQDNDAVNVIETLERLTANDEIPEIIIAGIYAGDRMQEYGMAHEPDYLGRGSKAKAYADFIAKELVPFLCDHYPIDETRKVIAGYSLGALSAVDIAWNHPHIFQKAGAFSGSFWWRKVDAADRKFNEKHDRLMQAQVRNAKTKPALKFWFQAGAKDEHHDRNGNGVIDAIDDTLDLITELSRKGYRPYHDIEYVEMQGGEHNQRTWAAAMPRFLKWAFGSY